MPIFHFTPATFALPSVKANRLLQKFRTLDVGDVVHLKGKNDTTFADVIVFIDPISNLFITSDGHIVPLASYDRIEKVGGNTARFQIHGPVANLISNLYPQLNLRNDFAEDDEIAVSFLNTIPNTPVNWDTIAPGDEFFDPEFQKNAVVGLVDRENSMFFTTEGDEYLKAECQKLKLTGCKLPNWKASPALTEIANILYPEK